MTAAFVLVNTGCNLSCSYCFYVVDEQRHTRSRLRADEFGRVLDLFEAARVEEVVFSGGEPLLRPDVPSFVDQATRRGLATSLITNGTRVDDGVAKALEEAGLGAVTVSLDGAEAAIHESIRGQGSYAPTIRAIRSFVAVGIPLVSVNCVVTRANVRHVRSVVRLARRLGATIDLQPAWIPSTSPDYAAMSLHEMGPDERTAFARHARDWGDRAGRARYVELLLSMYGIGPSRAPKRCGMGRDDIVVDADGRVYPCFHRRDLLAGDALSDPPAAIVAALRAAHRQVMDARCYGEHCVSLFNTDDEALGFKPSKPGGTSAFTPSSGGQLVQLRAPRRGASGTP